VKADEAQRNATALGSGVSIDMAVRFGLLVPQTCTCLFLSFIILLTVVQDFYSTTAGVSIEVGTPKERDRVSPLSVTSSAAYYAFHRSFSVALRDDESH
jgi:hypothetical protein